mmetsp:Transcript_13061/g.37623  ORF Transcript_13061/g.37623 Transcript_13061/m.37623 type:complete len:407 (+) Transcript_13061:1214-2434(+)
MRLDSVRLLDDTLDVVDLEHLLEGLFLHRIRQPLLEHGQHELASPLAAFDELPKLRLKLPGNGQDRVHHLPTAVGRGAAQRGHLLIEVHDGLVQESRYVGQLPAHRRDELIREIRGEIAGSHVLEVSVLVLLLEELELLGPRLVHAHLAVNVALAPVHHTDPPISQNVRRSVEDISTAGPRVHDVNLREHTDGPLASRIDLTRQSEGVGGRKIGVGGSHSQDNHVLVLHVVPGHVLELSDDALRLPVNGNLRNSWHVNHRKARKMRADDSERHRHRTDDGAALLCVPFRLFLNLLPDGLKVVKLLTGQMAKLAVLRGILVGRGLQLELQRAAGHDTGAPGQKVAAHDRLQHRRLPRRLTANDDNLRQLPRERRQRTPLFVAHLSVPCDTRNGTHPIHSLQHRVHPV